MGKKRNIHVVPHPEGGWATKKEGAGRTGSRTKTQKEAIEKAKSQAKRDKVEVVIYGKDGKISDSDNYGNDLHPPKDEKH